MSLGRADSNEEKSRIAKKVASYLLGDKSKGVEPMSISDIAKVMGFKSRKSVYAYKDIAIKEGFLAVDLEGKAILPAKTVVGDFKKFTGEHSLLDNELVSYWFKKQLNKKGGSGVKVAKPMLNMLERLFNTLKITPEMLVIEKSNKVVEDYRDEFLEHCRNETDVKVRTGGKKGSLEIISYRINYALASFCAVNGISWARGDPAMSRKIVGHGQYADIRLTDEEFVIVNDFIIKNFGMDSDEFRWFWVGVESCSRQSALISMKLDYTTIASARGGETLVLKAYESKTKQINGGIWKKFIKRKDTIDSLKALKSRGGTRIYENKDNLSQIKFNEKMIAFLKSCYAVIGKDEDSYFMQKPNHALRHIGGHYWLAKGNYSNHVIVAKIGGWHTVDELIKSYGEIPPEKVNQELDKYDY
ncbi:hypothetical protein ES702_02812 [subsurface metagenome]